MKHKPPYPFEIKVMDSERVYDGFYQVERYTLRQKDWVTDDWSQPFYRELVVKKPVVVVLAHDPKRDVVVLLQQFRAGTLLSPAPETLFECVAGIVDEGELPLAAAHRELQEEAGVQALSMDEVMRYWVSPGGCSEQVVLYYATVDASDVPQRAGEASEMEQIQLHCVSLDEALAWMAQGWINNSATLIALMWLRDKQLRGDD